MKSICKVVLTKINDSSMITPDKADGIFQISNFWRMLAAFLFSLGASHQSLEAEKVEIVPDTNNPKITVNWRFTNGALSPAWRRLFRKLLASRKEKPTSTGEAAANGESKR